MRKAKETVRSPKAASEAHQRFMPVMQARWDLCQQMPYFAMAARELTIIDAPGAHTSFCRENWLMGIDLDWFAGLDRPNRMSTIYHELSHLLRETFARERALGVQTHDEHCISNIASDQAINHDGKEAGLGVLESDIMPETIGVAPGTTHEEAYRWLKKHPDRMPGEQCSCFGLHLPKELLDALDAQGAKLGGGRGAGTVQIIIKATAEAIKKAQTTSKLSGGWVTWAEQVLAPPKVPWRTKLQRLIRTVVGHARGRVDFTWRRRSRKQAGLGDGPNSARMPALYAPQPVVGIAMDTSGSMGAAEYHQALPEIEGICKAVGAAVRFYSFDVGVHDVRIIRSTRDARFVGGGGTSFVEVLDLMAHDRVKLAILMTDGHGTAPAKPPPMDVIWTLLGAGATCPVPWGEQVRVEP